MPSQGVHIVLDRSFLPGEDALMIPRTDDGRVLFAIPWHSKIIIGTTDTPVRKASLEPVALKKEISFLLTTAGKYLKKIPSIEDVLSIYAGLRPLAAPADKNKKTKEISRSHKIITSKSGLLTIIGGKWTTYRKMAEDIINRAESLNRWKRKKTHTKKLRIHGYKESDDMNDPLYIYGTDRDSVLGLAVSRPELSEMISLKLKIIKAQVVWAVREEMAVTVEDFLSRRTRCQLLDARESILMAPKVARLMATELGKNEAWEQEQIVNYELVTRNYISM